LNWVADENIDSAVVERLRAAGHRVWYVAEASPGADDEAVFEFAETSGALLLTADKDFAALCFQRRSRLGGVVLLRLAGLNAGAKAERLLGVVSEEGDRLLGAFSVVGPQAWRVRETPKGRCYAFRGPSFQTRPTRPAPSSSSVYRHGTSTSVSAVAAASPPITVRASGK
jgi:predicted nuclease of predicted toxin-antitoxin system